MLAKELLQRIFIFFMLMDVGKTLFDPNVKLDYIETNDDKNEISIVIPFGEKAAYEQAKLYLQGETEASE